MLPSTDSMISALAPLRWGLLAGLAGAAVWAWPQLSPLSAGGIVCALVVALVVNGKAVRRRLGDDLWAGSAMIVDVLLVTLLLGATGGAENPFRGAFLVQIVLAALVLSPRWSAAVVVIAVLGDLSLLLTSPHLQHPGMRGHLVGMWLSLAVVGPFVTVAITRLQRALHQAHEALLASRATQERSERLAALATLAAGAAHELATPLATIAVTARELQLRVAEDPRAIEDATLVCEQVERCRRVLRELSLDAGAAMGEAATFTTLGELLEEAMRGVKRPERVEIVGDDAHMDARLRVPARSLGRALRGLLDNALRAAPDGPVSLTGRILGERVEIAIRDGGPGMSAALIACARDPFFTTRASGEGMGLGLFVAESLAHQLGGALVMNSEVGRGTLVTVSVPRNTR